MEINIGQVLTANMYIFSLLFGNLNICIYVHIDAEASWKISYYIIVYLYVLNVVILYK